jgi:hypothetical protein
MAYIAVMKVYSITSLGNSPSAGDLFTIAVNKMEVQGTDTFSLYVDVQADSVTSLVTGTEIAGDNEGIKSLTPEFYPYATEGAECCAFVTSLTWADNNLHDYEYVCTDDGSGTSGFLVFGELNSTKTQFNDPFGGSGTQAQRQGFVDGACWDGQIATNFVA